MSSGFVDNTKRSWQQREMAMVTEFLVKENLLAGSQTRVRLGHPHQDLQVQGLDSADLSLLRLYSRWADAVIFQADKTILIEAKIRPSLGPLEALEVYSQLFFSDPMYKERHNLPLEKWFLYAVEDPVLKSMAYKLGIKPILYQPLWLQDYFKLLNQRERRAPLTSGFNLSA